MSDFKTRKQRRQEQFGLKERPCTACNGSGYYDDNGNPKCSSCNGTGKGKYKPERLILLKRINPEEYEIHRGGIEQTKNLILTTKDKQLATDLVEGYNQLQHKMKR